MCARAHLLSCVVLAGCAAAQLAVEPVVLPVLRAEEASRFTAVLKVSDGLTLVNPETRARTNLAATPDGLPESVVILPGDAFVVTTANAAYLGSSASPGHYERLDERPPGMSVVASDETGRTLIWYPSPADEEAGEYLLRAPGQTELIPFASVAFPGEASVSADGRFAAVSGTVRPCANLTQCPMRIWIWRIDSQQITPLATPPGRAAYKPQFVTNSLGATWLYYQTTSYDDSPRCAANLNACEHTIVRRRAEGGPETVVARRAFAFAAGRDGVTAYLSHDVPGCDNVRCGMLQLHVVDVRGDRVVADTARSLRPRAFSPDGRWLLYRSTGDGVNALRLRTGEVEQLGDGYPMGWLASD